ncbi:MAG: Stk1 family PASTA domain-containing Ser/Thr kinase [Clostridiales bacterium]|nr:Stk1 family PASTA domain-containing Ser/Thr kinase [Clostridiales bacterium]MDY3745265.1 Stk1 family PASTA domain-containing Ser/Thr kinase [Lachnospiraceae bacterium]
MLVPGMYLADRYEIIEKIGSGGMADVYKAKCHKLNRLVAIKVLKPEFSTDATFVKKFRVEAQSAAGLSHPNIVNVYDVGEESGIYYIVMELVQGITLKNYIDMKGKLEVREALNISIQIASGLSAAHQNRIIHRDVKPQNIIMSRDGKVKVTDFGIAKVADSTTVTTTAAGSVHYISPEQARGGYSDEKSDIYSLGITMYEMLTGKVPFDGETNVAVALLHIQGEMVPPRKLEPSIPRSFEKIILKCTQKKPDKRYASAKELIADLRRVLSNPDGEYVVLAGSVADASTMVISDQDMAAMRQARSASNNVRPSGTGGSQRPPQRSEAEQRRQEELRRQRAAEAARRKYEEENDEEDDDDDDSEVNPKLEKVMIGLGIVGAIILVIAVCFIIGKAVGLVGGTGSKDKDTQSGTVTESVTDTQTETQSETKMIGVVGLTKNDAEARLRAAGINATFEEKADDSEKGMVIGQDPVEGTMITSDTKVTVYYSSGKETFELGDYSKLTQSEAKNKLEINGLILGDVDYEYSDTIEEGCVTKTEPAAGTEVTKGDKIKIWLSKGKKVEMTSVPSIIGSTEDVAKSAIASAGLQYGGSTTEYSEDAQKGTVISFTVNGSAVSAGTQVEKGSTVKIVISAGSQYEGQTVSETVTLSNYLFDDDITSGEVVVKYNEEVVWSKSDCTNNDFPITFTLRDVYGTKGYCNIYLDGIPVGNIQVTFDGK